MHNRSICLVERVEAMTRAHRYDWPPTLIDRTEPFRRQVLLTVCLEITCQVLLNDFRRLYGWGRLSSSPEVNSLIVSVCQVSFSYFFSSRIIIRTWSWLSENISNPQVGSRSILRGLNACSYHHRQEKKPRAHTMCWYENSAVMADR